MLGTKAKVQEQMKKNAVEAGTEPHLKNFKLGSCFPDHIKADLIRHSDLDVKWNWRQTGNPSSHDVEHNSV